MLDRIGQFAGQQPGLWKRLGAGVFEGRVPSLLRSLRRLVGADARSEQARQELRVYLRRHAGAITAVDRFRGRLSPQVRPLLTHGARATEKNIETVMARRRAARRLLKLRIWISRCGKDWFEALYSSQLINA